MGKQCSHDLAVGVAYLRVQRDEDRGPCMKKEMLHVESLPKTMKLKRLRIAHVRLPPPPIHRTCPLSHHVLGLFSQIEMIHRATQWSRDMNKAVVYLPHCVGGKLHVLEVQNGFAEARPDEAGRCGGGGSKGLEDNERLISVESFLKGDFARFVCPQQYKLECCCSRVL